MKAWKIVIAGGLLVAMAACKQEPTGTKPPTNPEVDPKPVAGAQDSLPASAGHTKIYTIGYPINGVPSLEWALFEEYSYDAEGRQTGHLTHFSGRGTKTLTTYDPQGHETLRVVTNTGKDAKVEFRSTYSPDFLVKTTEEYSSEDGRVVAKKVFSYNAQGTLLSVAEEDNHLVDYPQNHKIEYILDAQGRVVSERETVGKQSIVGAKYAYDAAGNRVRAEHMTADGKPSQAERWAYDAQGHKVTRWFQDFSAFVKTEQLSAKYEYDGGGRLMRELHYGGNCEPAGEQSGKCFVTETISYSYDDQGRVTLIATERQQGEPKVMKKRFEYRGTAPTGLDEAPMGQR